MSILWRSYMQVNTELRHIVIASTRMWVWTVKALSTLCETSTGLSDGNYAAILAAVWLVHNPIVTLAACETRQVQSTPTRIGRLPCIWISLNLEAALGALQSVPSGGGGNLGGPDLTAESNDNEVTPFSIFPTSWIQTRQQLSLLVCYFLSPLFRPSRWQHLINLVYKIIRTDETSIRANSSFRSGCPTLRARLNSFRTCLSMNSRSPSSYCL